MKAVQVRYVVQPEYAEQNKVNIRNVMDALKANPNRWNVLRHVYP
jgi:hypothetical protein